MKNILFIIIDGLRKDRMGCYGYHRKTTPNLDEFHQNGLTFNKCIAPQNNTLSAFATILTGRHPLEHGLLSHDDDDFEIKDTILFEVMQKKGYQTIFISPIVSKCKWTIKGVDVAIDPKDKDDLVYSKNVIKHFNNIKKDKPFFAILHFYNCRHPFEHKYVKKYFNKNLETSMEKQSQEYDNGLRQFDTDIKPLLDKHKDDKILILSDHGIHLGERGLVDQHFALDQHIINVPFMTNFGGVGYYDNLFSQEDIAYLILDGIIKIREYILAYEKTRRETVAVITPYEIKKFEVMI